MPPSCPPLACRRLGAGAQRGVGRRFAGRLSLRRGGSRRSEDVEHDARHLPPKEHAEVQAARARSTPRIARALADAVRREQHELVAQLFGDVELLGRRRIAAFCDAASRSVAPASACCCCCLTAPRRSGEPGAQRLFAATHTRASATPRHERMRRVTPVSGAAGGRRARRRRSPRSRSCTRGAGGARAGASAARCPSPLHRLTRSAVHPKARKMTDASMPRNHACISIWNSASGCTATCTPRPPSTARRSPRAPTRARPTSSGASIWL